MKTHLCTFVLAALFLPLFAQAASDESAASGSSTSESAVLAPITSDATPAETLKTDKVVPAATGKTKANATVGDVSKELANDLPFHSNSNLKPGNETNFAGVGKGAEETDVNMLGIPLNRAQGGGADLGSFPQFIWSGYSYQIGPSLGAFDPRGVGGSLTLRLWTQDNLGVQGSRVTGLYSSRDVQQYSVARSGKDYALLVGQSLDLAQGPTFAASAIPLETGNTKVTTHLLFTDVTAKNFASERSGSMTGEQETLRLIPVVQVDQRISSKTNLKTSFFYDNTNVDYTDATNSDAAQTKDTRQYGNESAFVSGDTRVGFGVRNVSYERTTPVQNEQYPSEWIANTQLTQGFHYKSLLIEPTVGGYGVTKQGFFPTFSLGVRNDVKIGEGKFGQFARAGFTRRFSSLLDRYYEINQQVAPNFTLVGLPNPDLQPENVRSIESGIDYTNESYKTQLIGFVRDYKHARYTRFFFIDPPPGNIVQAFQVVNAGNAHVYGFTHSQDLRLLPVLDVGTRVALQSSMIDDLGSEFPYTPKWVGIVKADIHTPSGRAGLSLVGKGATSFTSYSESNKTQDMAGYGYLDAFIHAEITRDLNAVAGVENVFDRQIQYRYGMPAEGRAFSLAANAVF